MKDFGMGISGRVSSHCYSLNFIQNFILLNVLLIFPTGGGITDRNLQRILEGSGATEFHCSARSARDSGMKFR